MNENRILLFFPTSIKDLTGNSYGRKIFEQQVEPKWREDMHNIIELPENIEDVGSSFVQGMYTKISEKYGKRNALEYMSFDSENEKIIEKIKKSIRTYGI